MTFKTLSFAASLLITAPALAHGPSPVTTDEARALAARSACVDAPSRPLHGGGAPASTDEARALAARLPPRDTTARVDPGAVPATTDEARALAGEHLATAQHARRCAPGTSSPVATR